MPQIFVSHSHYDDNVGLRLVGDLRAQLGDDAVWYDAAGGLRVGDRWWRKIVSEITARDTFIVILSPEAVASPWVQREMDLAYYLQDKPGRRLLPLIYRPCELSADWQVIHSLPISDPVTDPEAYTGQLATLCDELLGPAHSAVAYGEANPIRLPSPQHSQRNGLEERTRQVARKTWTRHRLLASIISGARFLICCVALVLYWLLVGYTTPSIFPEAILRISGSDHLIATLRGNDSNTEFLKALVVLVSLTADWYAFGTVLTELQVPDMFSVPYGILTNVLGFIVVAVLLLLAGLYFLLLARGWRYINVINIRKTLEVMLVTALLMFASQIRLFGALYLYFPVVASITSLSLFLYGVISLGGSQSGDGSRGFSAKLEQRLQRQIRDREWRQQYLKNR